VRSLVDLSLAPEHRRGHGALYDGLNHGKIEIARLRRGVAGLPLPRLGERIVLAVDVSPWLRLWVPRTWSPHATCVYSCRRPPSRSRRSTRMAASERGWVSPAGGR
jgi:hypothetical protein